MLLSFKEREKKRLWGGKPFERRRLFKGKKKVFSGVVKGEGKVVFEDRGRASEKKRVGGAFL